MSAETWGIVLRDRATGAEQWVACEVTRNGAGVYEARVGGMMRDAISCALSAAYATARLYASCDPLRDLARVATPAEYIAHMSGVCLTLAIDEANDLRAEVTRLADTLGAIGRSVGAESCERDVILAAIRDRGEDAFRRGAEAMREAAAKRSDDSASWYGEHDNLVGGGAQVASMALRRNAIQTRALPLPTEATPQPAQSHEAPATPDAPLTIADAAARARSAAAQRAECDHRWVTTLDGRRVICMRCHETRLRSTVLR